MIRAALLIILLIAALPAAAQSAVHRCVGKDGTRVYTDQPCETLGARSVEPPAATSSAATPAGLAPSTGLLCAQDMATLRVAVANAFTTRDANKIGGLTLWTGYGSGGAVENIRSLQAVVRQTLLSLEGDETGIDAVTRAGGGDDATHHVHFPVVKDSGCLWLRPPTM
ncbi:DUF4124 domain-containing protein [Luteibacter yeojuensis]|uniref:DUF4124 domain-containing protein n=1 Tax=Luteibacter yeojuensis TaxID=345309 RepID=UPI0006979436|nr:DUF4124 domain-containing protein [Luteibacter yeojuensis]